ncbi:MAG TPA: DUF2065 domain-containing protein [Gammaproteobacteria bacterium]|nr:DUF2065 domain-containing protein [Gammaproteobacteria bacterium]
MDWKDFGAAFALLLVIEGLLPFISPGGFKRSMQQIQDIPDPSLRNIGLATMIAGLALLYWARSE